MSDVEQRRQRLIEADHRHLWHPFTQMQDWLAEEPLIIVAGHGAWLVDIAGREYLDGVSSLWVNVHGHRREEIDRAVREQLGRIAHSTLLGLANEPSIVLAERLAAIAPGELTRVFYSDNGSTAVEIALKMAFQYWQQARDKRPSRTKFLALREGYHGDTLGAVSVGGIDLFHALYRPLLFETLRAPAPYCLRCELGLRREECGLDCAEELGRLLAEHEDEIAAVVVEPVVQAAGGIIVQPEGYLRRVAEHCRRHDVFLIADEVATGFGRTGKMFACEHEGVRPDFLALAKGLTGGYLPLAATLTTERVFDGFLGEYAARRTFYHGHTYTGNPLACAAALASLELFDKEHTLHNVRARAEQIARALAPLGEHPHVAEVRQKGLMVGIELVAQREPLKPYPFAARMGHRVAMRARRYGVIIRPLGDVVVLMPPLCISEEETAQLSEAVLRAIDDVTLAEK